jgi:hypothetical protein
MSDATHCPECGGEVRINWDACPVAWCVRRACGWTTRDVELQLLAARLREELKAESQSAGPATDQPVSPPAPEPER